jgi:hypothetical protein
MKIIKKPSIPTITCSFCGCVFQPKYRDLIYSSGSLCKNEVICPFCRKYLNIKFKGQQNER